MVFGYIMRISFEKMLILLLLIIFIKIVTNTSRVKKLEKEIDAPKKNKLNQVNNYHEKQQ